MKQIKTHKRTQPTKQNKKIIKIPTQLLDLKSNGDGVTKTQSFHGGFLEGCLKILFAIEVEIMLARFIGGG